MIQLYLLACDSQTNHNYNNNNNADVAFANDETKQTTIKSTLNLNNVLFRLRNECNIQSIMVEGGAGILSSFLSAVTDNCINEKDHVSSNGKQIALVDCMCVTICPSILGAVNGIPCFRDLKSLPSSMSSSLPSPSPTTLSSHWIKLGNDCVFLSRFIFSPF